MIVLGGFDCTNSLFLSQKDKIPYPLSTASIFDSQTTQWYDQRLTGNIPNARTFHTAIKSNVSTLLVVHMCVFIYNILLNKNKNKTKK